MSNAWNTVFSAEGLRRVWQGERHPTLADMIHSDDLDEKGEMTEAGYQRIADTLNNLVDAMNDPSPIALDEAP